MSRGVVAKRAVGGFAVAEVVLIGVIGQGVPVADWLVTVTVAGLVALVTLVIVVTGLVFGRIVADVIERVAAQRVRAQVRLAASTGWDQALALIPQDGVSPAMDGLDWRKWMELQLALCVARPGGPVPDALLLPPLPPPPDPQPGDRVGRRTYVTEIGAKTSGLPYQMVRRDNGTTAWFTLHDEWDEEEGPS